MQTLHVKAFRNSTAALLCFLCVSIACVAAAQPVDSLDRLDTRTPIRYFVGEGEADSQFRPGDVELAVMALDDWSRASGRHLKFVRSGEDEALIRIHFVPASAGQYGVTRAFVINGQRAAEVYVRPDTSALGDTLARQAAADPLLRDTIVYLTCLHEIGHALGLGHTGEYADIMYAFGYGGDIPRYFGRYRERLRTRDDIAAVSGVAPGDLAQLRALYELAGPAPNPDEGPVEADESASP